MLSIILLFRIKRLILYYTIQIIGMKRLFIILVCALGVVIASPQSSASQRDNNSKTISSETITSPTMKPVSAGVDLSCFDGQTHRFYIYSITGQMIKSIEVTDGHVYIELPKGFYIVKCDSWSKQLVIR